MATLREWISFERERDMEDHSSLRRDGNFAEDSCRALNEEAALRRFRIRLHDLLRKQAWPSKSPSLKARLSDSDLVEEAKLRAWDRFAEFRGNTPEEFATWMLQILDDVIDEAHPFS
jgi:hypothetical protein